MGIDKSDVRLALSSVFLLYLLNYSYDVGTSFTTIYPRVLKVGSYHGVPPVEFLIFHVGYYQETGTLANLIQKEVVH